MKKINNFEDMLSGDLFDWFIRNTLPGSAPEWGSLSDRLAILICNGIRAAVDPSEPDLSEPDLYDEAVRLSVEQRIKLLRGDQQ